MTPLPTTRAGVLRVTEHYACYEGEGSTLGALTYLIRLSGCDLRCWWCDSKFSSFREDEAREVSVAALEKAALKSGAAWVSFTGGEPTWRGTPELKALRELANKLRARGLQVKIESNGRHLPNELKKCVDLWSLAPKWDGKLGRQTEAMNFDEAALKSFVERAPKVPLQLKFVITFDQKKPRPLDLKAAADLLKRLGASAPVFFIPEAYAQGDYLARCKALEQVVAKLAKAVLKGWDLHVQPQWHRVLHGDARAK